MVDRPYLLTSDPPPPPPIEVRVAPIERPIYYSGPPTQETGIGSLQPLLGLKNEIRTQVNRHQSSSPPDIVEVTARLIHPSQSYVVFINKNHHQKVCFKSQR